MLQEGSGDQRARRNLWGRKQRWTPTLACISCSGWYFQSNNQTRKLETTKTTGWSTPLQIRMFKPEHRRIWRVVALSAPQTTGSHMKTAFAHLYCTTTSSQLRTSKEHPKTMHPKQGSMGSSNQRLLSSCFIVYWLQCASECNDLQPRLYNSMT